MQLDFWSKVFWILGFVLTLSLFGVLIFKKRYRTIPWFTLLVGQDALQTIVMFAVHRLPYTSFYTYYAFEVLDAILRVLVIWEVARILIQRHLGLHLHDEIRSYWIAFLAMLVIAIGFIAVSGNSAMYMSQRVALRISQVSTIGVGGLLLMVLWLTFFFRVKVRVHAQAIVYGLSLYLFGKFLVEGVVMLLGLGIRTQAEAWLRPVYLVSLLLWIVCLWREEPDRPLSDEMYRMVRQGRAGINPPLPESILEEHAEAGRRLVFSVRETRELDESMVDESMENEAAT